jgi:hypothetical protein
MLEKLCLACTPLSDGCFGVLAGTFAPCQQPHSLSLKRSPRICPISSGQSKSKNVDLKRKIIHLRADQTKTASRRIIPVSDNLRAWLLPRVRKGRVVPDAEMQKKVAPLDMMSSYCMEGSVHRVKLVLYH